MFRFSLESVLDVRRRAEEAAQREVAQAMSALNALRERRVADENHLDRAYRENCALNERGYDPARQLVFESFARDMRARIQHTRLQEEAAAKVVEERRVRLIAAAQRRQVMEELKKVELEAYNAKDRKDERKRNDDIAVFAFGRRQQEKVAGDKEA